MRVPWTANRLNQSVLKEICSLEGQILMLKSKLKYFDHIMRTLMLGLIEGRRRRVRQRMRLLDSVIDALNMKLGRLKEIVEDREAGTTGRLNNNNILCPLFISLYP